MIEFVSNHAPLFAIFAVSLVAGFVLGLRFRVLILVPAIVICVLVIAAAGFSLRSGLWPTVIAAVSNAVGLQIGYLLGICAAFALLPRRGDIPQHLLGSTAFSLLDRAAASRRTPGSSPPARDKS